MLLTNAISEVDIILNKLMGLVGCLTAIGNKLPGP
jgi:hypothetical protein